MTRMPAVPAWFDKYRILADGVTISAAVGMQPQWTSTLSDDWPLILPDDGSFDGHFTVDGAA